MEKSLTWREFIITRLIQTSGYSAILFVALIFFFLLREGLPALGEVKASSLLNIRWYPIENYFGILPLLTGSLIVTLGAGLIAVPFGIGTAVYISEMKTAVPIPNGTAISPAPMVTMSEPVSSGRMPK